MLKLDLGAGSVSPPGFTPLGNVNGTAIYPLPHGDGTVDAIRASHVLEHFSHREIGAVIADWVRTLKPGGTIRIAVPDFARIAEGYLAGAQMPTEGYLMGGQVDAADFHKALFDESSLRRALASAGLVLIRPWASELDDCAALPISLNLEGTKPHTAEISTSAVISLPRVTWTNNAMCWVEGLAPLGVKVRCYTGAFWGQCLERAIEEALATDESDLIMTLDYDTVFSRRDASTLIQLMMAHPEADAIAPIQAHRGKALPLFTMRSDDGSGNASKVPMTTFGGDLTKVATAHFGLTVMRAAKLRALSKPWFHDQPSPVGDWNEGRVDADIGFWRKWEEAGNSLYLANRVPVGHIEVMVRWPGSDLQAIYQPCDEWRKDGAPAEVWK